MNFIFPQCILLIIIPTAILWVPLLSFAAGCWVEVVNFDPCNSPISGNTNAQYDATIGLYVGFLENAEWKAKVGYSSGSINEVGASCESALARNPALICPPGNLFFNKANGDSLYSCEESYNAQWWGGYWMVLEWTCYPTSACRHYSTITYSSPGGQVAQVLNDYWDAATQQVIQLWKWVPECDLSNYIDINLGVPACLEGE